MPKKAKAIVVAPNGRRQMWRVITRDGFYRCDSQEIAYELAARLNRGRAPGWVARDLRTAQL